MSPAQKQKKRHPARYSWTEWWVWAWLAGEPWYDCLLWQHWWALLDRLKERALWFVQMTSSFANSQAGGPGQRSVMLESSKGECSLGLYCAEQKAESLEPGCLGPNPDAATYLTCSKTGNLTVYLHIRWGECYYEHDELVWNSLHRPSIWIRFGQCYLHHCHVNKVTPNLVFSSIKNTVFKVWIFHLLTRLGALWTHDLHSLQALWSKWRWQYLLHG